MATFGEQMRALMGTRGVSLHGLARATNYDVSYLCKVANGRRPPSPAVAKALDNALGAGGELVASCAQAAELERLRGRTLGVSASAPSEDDDMERRRLMRDAAAVAAVGAVAPVLTALTDAWRTAQRPMPGATVSQSMIDDWEHAADVHEERAYLEPPAVVLSALAVDFIDMAPHLARTQPDTVQRGLAHAAARHSALIAGKWFDLGNGREAHRWWAQTRTLSQQSGDTRLTSWLIGWEAAYRKQDPRENLGDVLLVGQEARRLAGDNPSAALVAALGIAAQTLAMMGRHAEAVAALRQAEETLERLPPLGNSREGRQIRALWYDRALIYTLAGDTRRAEEALSTAQGLYPAGHRTAILLALHGAALHAQTDPNQGTDQALRLIGALPAERRDTRVKSATRLVINALPEKARGLDSARELRALMSA